MIKISGIKQKIYDTPDALTQAAIKRLALDPGDLLSLTILKKSLVKDKDGIFYYNYTLAVSINGEDNYPLHRRDSDLSRYTPPVYISKKAVSPLRPVVVGFGPAGIFAALILAESGMKPIILERGPEVSERKKKVELFTSGGSFDPEANVQFGEGGAGAFSDGKLKPGFIDSHKFKVLSEFVKSGAPEDILYIDKPHVGTDRLCEVISALRKRIISLGGEIFFGAKLTGIVEHDGIITAAEYESKGKTLQIAATDIILAIGHSARDSFSMLRQNKLIFSARSFGIGMRLEHPQSYISKLIYGSQSNEIGHAADYHLVSHIGNDRTVYSFCMCPGGYVMAATSEENAVVTNGMSLHSRNGENANSAILVSVTEKDIKSTDPFAGIELQRKIEHSAFTAAGRNYHAPIQLLGDFMKNIPSVMTGSVMPSYLPGTEPVPAEEYLPSFITDALRSGINDMNDYLPGFLLNDAVFTGPETRSTSPVRMERSERLEAIGFTGLYPCGEGAGYSGGIVSSAVDGIKCAEAIIAKYS